jgi:hypothetical protein
MGWTYLACRCKSVREGRKLALNLANEFEDLFVICRNRDQLTNVKEDGRSIDLEDRSRKNSDCLGRAKLLIIRSDNSYRVRIAVASDLRRGLEGNFVSVSSGMFFRGLSISGPPLIWTVTESIVIGSVPPRSVTVPATGKGWFSPTTALGVG